MLTIIFGQLTNSDSLRDLIVAIEVHSRKTYHLGFGKSVTRSNLAKTNENRNSKVFEEFAYYLIDVARQKLSNFRFFDQLHGSCSSADSITL